MFFFCLFCYRFTGTVRKVPRENSIEKKNILRLRVDDWYGISCRKVVPTGVFWNEHGREGDEKYKKEIHESSSQKKKPGRLETAMAGRRGITRRFRKTSEIILCRAIRRSNGVLSLPHHAIPRTVKMICESFRGGVGRRVP